MKNKSKHEIMETIIAALLHDIGKFYQRTGEKLGSDPVDNSFIKDYGSYKHAAFTSKFISKYLPQLNNYIYPAASHHQVNSEISKADHLASAHDRKSDVEEDQEYSTGRYDYILKRLNSIFNDISLTSKKDIEKKYVEITDLDNYSYIDHQKEKDIELAKKKYKHLFDEFVEECKRINESDIINIHHYLYPLVKKYTTSIPSATYQKGNPGFKPTVSLFDHLKLSAAISATLKSMDYKYGEKNPDLKFVFLEYDLSGTQNFIYKVTEGEKTKGAIAKSLRTRSFFLVLLTDIVGYKILDEFNLSYENLLLSTGGRGIILLPKTNDFEERVNNAITIIEEEIYIKFKGDISFAIAVNEIEESEFENYYDKIMSPDKKQVIISKKQKFINLLQNDKFRYIKEPLKRACILCESNDIISDDLCQDCNKFIDLNTILVKNKNLIIEYDFANQKNNPRLSFDFGKLGKINIYTGIPTIDKGNFYLSINSNIIGESKYYANLNASGKTFSEIAKKSKGDKKLAVLKMDVDNLGLIFAKGLSKEYKTFSKILTLSRVIDYFFTKKLYDYLSNIEGIYINYSGGDDLVIITPASMILEITHLIISKFQEYTCNNPDFHLSAGIEIFSDKSPIRYAIKRADDNLIESKNIDTKNSTTIFNTTISNKSLNKVIKLSDIYAEKIEKGYISRGLIYKINEILTLSLESENSLEYYMRFIPHLAYSFARNIKDIDERENLKKIFVRKEIDIDILKIYKVIFTYALLKTRKVGGNDE